MKAKTVEKIIVFLVIFLFASLAYRYIFASLKGQRILSRIEELTIRRENEAFKKNSEKKERYSVEEYSLVQQEGMWHVYKGTERSGMFEVYESNGKIAIRRLSGDYSGGYTVSINEVRDYFSRQEDVVTDIPYDSGSAHFYIPEQEDMFPIFGYHNVFDKEENIVDPYVDVRERDFEGQLALFNRKINCNWFTLTDIVENYVLADLKIPRNTCVITFDDGRKNSATIVFPLLKKYGIRATYFIIGGRIGQPAYMDARDIQKVFHSGSSIEAHALTGGSLVDADWFEGEFTAHELWKQVNDVREILNQYGYDAKLFAYPLGEWDENVLRDIKNAGYMGARGTQKGNLWRDRRALSTSMDSDFIWHFNYYEPQLLDDEKIVSDASYTNRWQFEEGVKITDLGEKDVSIFSSLHPTEKSFATIVLEDIGDATENSFLTERAGRFSVNVFAFLEGVENGTFTAKIDGTNYQLEKDVNRNCVNLQAKEFCYFSTVADLSAGKHVLGIANAGGKIGVDFFQVDRIEQARSSYQIKVYDYLNID